MDVMVSMTDSGVEDVSTVVAALRAAGLAVADVKAAIGIVLGSVDDDRLDDLRAVPGVDAVEPQERFRIAPPDSDVQ